MTGSKLWIELLNYIKSMNKTIQIIEKQIQP